MQNETKALLLALASVALWSTVATAFKLALELMSPTQLLWLASTVSALFFWLVSAARRLFRGEPGSPALKQDRIGTVRIVPFVNRTTQVGILLGLLNPLAYYILLFAAYDRLPAQVAQPINYTWAIVLAIAAIPVLGQKLTKRGFLGILVGYTGVVILVTQGRLTDLAFDPLGVALALVSTVVWASYWLINTRLAADPVHLMRSGFTTAAVVLTLWCAVRGTLPELTDSTLALGAYVGLVEMGVTFLLWQSALSLTNQAGKIAQLIFLSPFLSLLLISSFLGEEIYPSSIIGLGVIVSGLLIGRLGDTTPEPEPK